MLKKLTITAIAAALVCAVYGRSDNAYPSHSDSADSVYADYCFRFEDKEDKFEIKLLLVEQYRHLELILSDAQDSLDCKSQSVFGSGHYFDLEFISESGKEVTRSWLSPLSHEGGYAFLRGRVPKLYPIQQVSVPSERYITSSPENSSKKDEWRKHLLSFESKIIDARYDKSFMCSPYFGDTGFNINYRVRMIGECEK